MRMRWDEGGGGSENGSEGRSKGRSEGRSEGGTNDGGGDLTRHLKTERKHAILSHVRPNRAKC